MGRHPGCLNGQGLKKMNKLIKKPPVLARWILRLFTRSAEKTTIIGDMDEYFYVFSQEKGKFRAKLWYRWQVLKSIFHFSGNFMFWSGAMFKNYIKAAFRNIKRHKGYSFINIAGLAIGITCFLLIILYVLYEYSYDNLHANSDRIFRVAQQIPGTSYMGQNSLAGTPTAMAPALKEEFPEVITATRFTFSGRFLLSVDKKSFYERGLFADTEFFNVFSFKLLIGDKNRVLEKLESIVISSRLSKKFFGNNNPIGKTLESSLGNFEIVGIVEDIPENSHIQFDWLIPFGAQFSAEERAERSNNWVGTPFYTYLEIRPGFSVQEFENKLNLFMWEKDQALKRETRRNYFLQPLKSIHLKSHLLFEFSANNDIKYIRLFLIIAVFILLIACANYMNLSTSQASKRFKEIGIRKVVGAQRKQIFRQFTFESVFISMLALLAGIGLMIFALPWFNRFIERRIELNFITTWHHFIILPAVLIFTGLISGVYPAIVFSSFKPVKILKKKMGTFSKGNKLRNILILFQFSITIILIISSLVMFRQINYIKNTDTGYNREQIVAVRLSDPGIRENLPAFKTKILQDPNVVDITTSSELPIYTRSGNAQNFKREDGSTEELYFHYLAVDYNFINVFQMEILKGRNFSEEYKTDINNSIIVNETFIKNLNWSDPVGKRLSLFGNDEKVVVGVVKDFHYQSFYHNIKPLIISCSPENYWLSVCVRLENIPATLEYFGNTYESFMTRYPLEFYFLDEQFNRLYTSEQKLGRMLVTFSGLAVFIACLGIFGVAAYTAERRIKEIGIRKVLGASIPGILALLSEGFIKWLLFANLISWPVAYYIMDKWLNNFAYRIDLTVWTFLLSGFLALGIAMLTVSYQTIKAATANPVDSLRYE